MINFFFPDLSKRSNDQELMDQANCNKKKLINTVKQFTLLNFLFTRSRSLLRKHVITDMLKNPNNSHTFLDIGAGGCDIPIWLLKKCNKLNLNIDITCIDNDKKIIEYAKNKCKSYNKIKIIQGNIFDLNKMGKFDYIFTNHFLHHFADDSIIKLLKIINNSTNRIFLLNDIYRSNASYLGYSLFTGTFLHNSFAFYDGRLSIKRGFIESDYEKIIKKTGLHDKIKYYKKKPARIYLLGFK